MQRMKDEGRDILKPSFIETGPSTKPVAPAKPAEVPMTNPAVKRKITKEDLDAHSSPEEPWFVVNGEG